MEIYPEKVSDSGFFRNKTQGKQDSKGHSCV